jgi:hypothetical protein
MSEEGKPAEKADPVKDLAMQIFVEFAAKHYAGGMPKGSPDPKAVAMLSFKLAEAFLRTDAALKESGMPKNQDFDMKAAELPGFGGARK